MFVVDCFRLQQSPLSIFDNYSAHSAEKQEETAVFSLKKPVSCMPLHPVAEMFFSDPGGFVNMSFFEVMWCICLPG